jgi:GT2 family glycosyltransferase
MKLSVIIVNFKAEKELLNCIKSIVKSKPGIRYEIIVVDNSKSKILKEALRDINVNVSYIRNNLNVGYGKGNNIGAKKAKGEFLLFLNPDTYIHDGSFKNILSLFKSKNLGIIAPLLLDNTEKPYPLQGTKTLTPIRALFSISILSKIIPNNIIAKKYWILGWNKNREKQVNVAPGTAFFIKKELFEKVGRFDENFFLFFEEFDICRRIQEMGKKVIISPKLKIVHFWGVSVNKNERSKRYFESSRFYYFRKYYSLPIAVLTEGFLRISFSGIVVSIIFLLGFALRAYKLPETMIFIGDQGWFYLSAFSMIKFGQIPLVGIPSSVVWLHQGPLATYFIALALFIGSLNPVAPAVLFGVLDCITITIIYFLTKNIFKSRVVGIFSAFFYATSPLVLLTARMPYHTSPIPFFVAIFLFLLYKIIKGKKALLPVLFFCYGLLIQLELSNAVLLLVILFLFFINKIRIKKREGIVSFAAFLAGILPFILYDLSHNFVQTLGFPLWVINRTRLFLGLTITHNSTTAHLPNAIYTIISQLEAIFSVYYPFVLAGYIVLFLTFVFLHNWKGRKQELFFLLAAILIPLISFGVHAAPGVAYFPLLFPIISVWVGASVYFVNKKLKIIVPLFIVLAIINIFGLAENNYYITTARAQESLPVNSYSYGYSVKLIQDAADFIAGSSKEANIVGRGFYSIYASNLDNIKYVLLTKNIKLSGSGKTFYVYPDIKSVPNKKDIIFSNRIYVITQK